jgi:large-conductance mechanosensitive channel
MAAQESNTPGSKPLSQKTDAELKREAKARLRRLDPATASELVGEVVGGVVGSPVAGFVEFLREHAIVGLAVGFVLATQVQAVVKQLIDSFVNPLFKLLLPGDKALSDRKFTLHFDGRHADFGWGAVAYALLDFLFIAVMIYAIIKIFKLDKLDKQK